MGTVVRRLAPWGRGLGFLPVGPSMQDTAGWLFAAKSGWRRLASVDVARACPSVVHRRHGSLLRRRLPPAHVWVDTSLWPGPPHSLLATAPEQAS